MKSFRIVLLTDYLNTLAGTEAMVVDTAVELKTRGHSVLVAVCPGELPVHDYWSARLARESIPLYIGNPYESTDTFCHKLKQYLRSCRPDLIHAIPIGRLALSWIQICGTRDWPCVASETSQADFRCTWYDTSTFPLFENFTAIIAQCASIADGVRETFGYKGCLATIPQVISIPEEQIQPLSNEDLANLSFLGSISRLRVEKGPEFLAAALALLHRHHDATLTIYGETPELQRFLDVSQALGVSSRLKIAGPFRAAEEIDGVIAPHCIFLLSSLFEGLPSSVLHTAARGRIMIATDVGGVRGVLEEIDPQCIVPLADPAAMAAAAARLLNDPDRVLYLSRRAVEIFKRHYHPAIVVPQLLNLYQEVAHVC